MLATLILYVHVCSYICTYVLTCYRGLGLIYVLNGNIFRKLFFEFIQGSAINFIGINYLATFLGTQTLGINFEEYSKLCMKNLPLKFFVTNFACPLSRHQYKIGWRQFIQ